MKTLVSIDTALLGHRLGYKKPTIHYIVKVSEDEWQTRVAYKKERGYIEISNFIRVFFEYPHRPTLAQLQKWLRDTFKTFVWVSTEVKNNNISYNCSIIIHKHKEHTKKKFKTYEKALDYGLSYSMEYLLENKK